MASYPRAVALAALQAALSSSWIAARELSPAKRRLLRVGTIASVLTVGYLTAPKETPDEDVDLVVGEDPFLASEGVSAGEDSPSDEPSDEPSYEPIDKRKIALAAGVIGLSVAAMVGRRQLEKRWLARLTRNGHAHPTRALAVRMAGVEFVGQLALQLNDVRKERALGRGLPR